MATDAELVGVAGSRAEGLALLRGTRADVLLVDLGLPDGSGIDVIKAMHLHAPGCSAIVSTVFGDEQHVVQAIEAGASGYLLKDSSPEAVIEELRCIHRGGSPISPIIARSVLRLLQRRDMSGESVTASTFAALEVESPGAVQALRTPEVPDKANGMLAPVEANIRLSPRETEVLELVAKGFSYDEIAARMDVSRHTVLTFVRRIYAKLEVNSKIEAVNEARRKGLLSR